MANVKSCKIVTIYLEVIYFVCMAIEFFHGLIILNVMYN